MKRLILLLLLAIGFNPAAFTQNQAKKHLNLQKTLAIEGYDPVAYQTEGKAVKGDPAIKLIQDGATYYFKTEQHRDVFLKSPAQYQPAYGGWCAYAMGKSGEKVAVDPETFKVLNGRTFLFYNRFFNNTLIDWNKDESRLKQQADLNWKKIDQ